MSSMLVLFALSGNVRSMNGASFRFHMSIVQLDLESHKLCERNDFEGTRGYVVYLPTANLQLFSSNAMQCMASGCGR